MKYIKLLIIIIAGIVLSSSFEQPIHTQSIEEIPEILETPLPLTADVLALRERIDRAIMEYSHHGFRYSLKIVSLDQPQVIYEHNEDEPMAPASNLKIVTTAAGFHFFSPQHRFLTEFYLSPTGDLYIKPSGDPTWNDKFRYKNLDSVFTNIADSLRVHSVRKIHNVMIEKGTFEQYQIENVWKPENRSSWYSAKPSNLAFYDNCVQVIVKPTKPGELAEVEIYPFNLGWEVTNTVYTTSNRRQQELTFTPDSLANIITVSGNIYSRAKDQFKYFATPRPDLYALDAFIEKFTEYEIPYTGEIYYVNYPKRDLKKMKYELLFSLSSVPLKSIVSEINKYSNNFMANQLFMNIGATQGHVWNTENIIKDWLMEYNIPMLNLKMYDGSGLSPYNRCTANTLVHILKLMHSKDYFEDYLSTLSIAGVDGTLRRHMTSPLLQGNVRAKTGYIQGARGLSGYITTLDGETLAFSFLANKEYTSLPFFYEMCEMVLEQVAEFTRG